MQKNVHVAAVDLFCWVGGLTRGLQDVGIDVVAGIDLDESCEFAYAANNRGIFITADVTQITGADLAKLYPKGAIRVLAGCAPCQPFSQLTRKDKTTDVEKTAAGDNRHSLLQHFGRLVDELRPSIVTMENVPNVRSEGVFDEFLQTLTRLKYKVEHKVINCADYGIPQSRRRFVLLATKKKAIKLPARSGKRETLASAIQGLEPLEAGEASKTDPLHKARSLTPTNLQRIRESVPGGSWDDWEDDLKLSCHKTEGGKTYRAVYGRMSWDKPASTITTQFFNIGTGRFGHPTQDRAVSLREGALIQTFPKRYKFAPAGVEPTFLSVGRHIGNAVPVKLGRVIGEAILNSVAPRS